MRVAFLDPSGQLGGAERSLLDILASLRTDRPDWELHLIVAEAGPLAERAEALGVKSHILPFSKALGHLGDAGVRGPAGDRVKRRTLLSRLLRAIPAVTVYCFRLRAVLDEIRPMVIHTNGFKMHILGIWSLPRGRPPLVWHLHDYISARPVMSRLLRLHSRRCAAVIANSHSVAGDARGVFREHPPVHTVYNAVDLETFAPEGPVLDLDSRSGLPQAAPETVRIGLVATLGRWKGHGVFLRALAEMAGRNDVRGYVVGGGLYQTDGSQYSLENLQQMAADLGLADRVGFTGFVDDPASAMRGLDIVVHASTQPEPFGLVIVEAMACSRALVASRAGGSTELFTPGVEALGFSPGDHVELASCLAKLVEDRGLRSRLAVEGRKMVEGRFDRRRLAGDLIPIYESVHAAGT